MVIDVCMYLRLLKYKTPSVMATMTRIINIIIRMIGTTIAAVLSLLSSLEAPVSPVFTLARGRGRGREGGGREGGAGRRRRNGVRNREKKRGDS